MARSSSVCWPGIERAPASFLNQLRKEAKARDWDANALLGHISHESKFNPAIKNPAGTASGLIQMIDRSAREYAGVSAAKLRTMSHEEQLPGILNYFDVGRPLAGPDFLLLGVSRNPALLSAPDSRVLYAAGSRAAELNPTLQGPSGAITVGSVRKHWRGWVAQNLEFEEECEVPSPAPAPPRDPSHKASLSPVAFAILLIGGWKLAKRRIR